jgi:hypothetical protein
MGHKKQALDASVNAFLNGLEDPVEAAQAIVPGIIICCQTFQCSVDNEIARQCDVLVDVDDYGLFDRTTVDLGTRTKKILTSQVFRRELQDIICIRDDLNNGMSRSEVCCMISDFFVVPFKTATNYFDYLRSKNMLPALKGGGQALCTQATTTNHTATTTENCFAITQASSTL